jgi:hypothetical protein
VRKVAVATFFIRFFGLSKVLSKLYPIAIKIEFGEVDANRVLNLLHLLRPKFEVLAPIKRFGSNHDGGYCLIDDFVKVDGVISLGIGDNNTFDVEIAQFVPIIEMYDHTIFEIPQEIPNGVFHKVGISAIPSDGFTTIGKILDNYPDTGNLILKIDIEGCEWEILDKISLEDLMRFTQIVGEFHDLFRYVNDLEFSKLVDRVLNKLEVTHSIYYVHANNWARHEVISGIHLPDVIEINFVRKDFNFLKSLDQSGTRIPSYPNNPEANELYFWNIT